MTLPSPARKMKRTISKAEREAAATLSAQAVTETLARLDAMEVFGSLIREEYEELIEQFGETDEHGSLIWSEAMCLEAGMIGFVTMRFLAKRGDREAAKYLMEKALGAPEQPFLHRIQNLTETEAEAYMFEIIRNQGLPAETAKLMVGAFTTGDLSGVEARLAAALPPEKPAVAEVVEVLKGLDGDELRAIIQELGYENGGEG